MFLYIYRVVVRPLVFGTIRAVTKGFRAALELAVVGPLARMRALMNFQVFQAGEGLVATGELIRAHVGRKEEKAIRNEWNLVSISGDSKSRIWPHFNNLTATFPNFLSGVHHVLLSWRVVTRGRGQSELCIFCCPFCVLVCCGWIAAAVASSPHLSSDPFAVVYVQLYTTVTIGTQQQQQQHQLTTRDVNG